MSDPVFLITGASSGIGAATARLASQAGYRVVLAARSVDRLQELASELDGAERALALEGTWSSRARSPAGARCRARSTRARSGR